VSFGSPQDVEVLVDGAWVPGAMLGWRHDDAGRCEAWVRLRSGGRGTGDRDAEADGSWVALATVRLPERHLALASVPATAAMPAAGAPAAPLAAATAAMAAVAPGVPAGRARRSRRHCAEVTAEQLAVPVVGAGRHRAPAGPPPGRHRALTAEMPAVTPEQTRAAPVAVASAPAAPAAQPAVEPDLLTRPIRLGDLVSGPRGGRPGVRPTA
jgi:hypothetical protein